MLMGCFAYAGAGAPAMSSATAMRGRGAARARMVHADARPGADRTRTIRWPALSMRGGGAPGNTAKWPGEQSAVRDGCRVLADTEST